MLEDVLMLGMEAKMDSRLRSLLSRLESLDCEDAFQLNQIGAIIERLLRCVQQLEEAQFHGREVPDDVLSILR